MRTVNILARTCTLAVAIIITGCPGVTPDPNPDALNVSLFCPSAEQNVGQPLTITATPSRATATTMFAVTGDATITTTDGNDVTVVASAAGEVTLTVTATDGSDTATDSCTINYTGDSQPEPLAIEIDCPGGITTTDDIAQISADANDPIAIITFASNGGELNDNADATATLTSDQPGQITVTATAMLDDQTATSSCTINFEAPNTVDAIPASRIVRAPFASACAQNVVNCTTSFPVAIIGVTAGEGQTVTETDDGFIVQGSSGSGVETVNLIGANSGMGNTASEIFYSWSANATDEDPCTLAPGNAFSTNANVSAAFAVGTHYVRLTVENDLTRDAEASGLTQCGIVPEGPRSDFREVTIEVRDMTDDGDDDDSDEPDNDDDDNGDEPDDDGGVMPQ